jgi:hypothetical protein
LGSSQFLKISPAHEGKAALNAPPGLQVSTDKEKSHDKRIRKSFRRLERVVSPRQALREIIRKSNAAAGYECPDCGERGGHGPAFASPIGHVVRCRSCACGWVLSLYDLTPEESAELDNARSLDGP